MKIIDIETFKENFFHLIQINIIYFLETVQKIKFHFYFLLICSFHYIRYIVYKRQYYTYLLDKFIYQDKSYITTLTLMKTSL